MSFPQKGGKGPAAKGPRWGWFLLALAGAALGALLFHAFTGQHRVHELEYWEFLQYVQDGSVVYARLSPSEIRGRIALDGITFPFRTARRGVENDTELYSLLRKHGVPFTGTRDGSGLPTLLLYLLPTVLLIGLFVLMMRRVGGGGSAMAFARSRARMYEQQEVKVTFDDVAGIDEAVDELREIVEFLKNPERFQALGGRMPKGLLLVGPPGTGKTLLAKAVAGEAGVPFFSMSGSEFVEMFVGVGAARVRDLFKQAQQHAPCIVFIDELDALGKTRGGIPIGGHDEREQTLNQLLVEMDGFDSSDGIIVMAATNRPETLDPALLRPGRFDRHVVVDRPDINGREAILRVHARHVKMAPDVSLREIAAMTPGFVGADLANLINEAALLAARSGRSEITRAELEEGIERVIAGLEKKRRVLTPEEKRRIAVHEAGHAVAALFTKGVDPVHKVSIIPRGVAALGYTLQLPEHDRYLATKSQLLAELRVLLAGMVAEELLLGEASSGAQNDLERATRIARHMVTSFGMSERLGRVSYGKPSGRFLPANHEEEEAGVRLYSEATAREVDEEIKRLIEDAARSVRELLEQRRAALERVADALYELEVIEADQLRTLAGLEQAPGHQRPLAG